MVDRDYWNKFYKKGEVPTDCSTFAASVFDAISHSSEQLFELGCGNGRDAFFFARKGVKTIACDIAETVTELQRQSKDNNPKFVRDDFTNLANPYSQKFGHIYSRFTLHSVPVEGASRTLKWSFDNLLDGGMLFIEVRSVLDPMCGVGTKVEGERDAWINTHYRRFIRKDELLEELKQLGFTIEYIVEENNLAVYKDDNPVVIRVHARKPTHNQ